MLLRVPGQIVLRCFHWSFRHNIGAKIFCQNVSLRSMSSKSVNDTPPEYIGSEAWKWKAEYNRRGPELNSPWFQSYIVCFSTAIFMIYFCVLREENDIDEKIGNPLYITAPHLEKTQLLVAYKYNKENGLDIADLEARLKEIEKEELKNPVSVIPNLKK